MRLDVLKAMNAGAKRTARGRHRHASFATASSDSFAAESVDADPLADGIGERRCGMGKSATVEHRGRGLFSDRSGAGPRLILIGAVHISQALAPIARIAGLDVSIIDPRTAFATPDRFPDTPVIAKWPDEALAEAPLDRYTAICL